MRAAQRLVLGLSAFALAACSVLPPELVPPALQPRAAVDSYAGALLQGNCAAVEALSTIEHRPNARIHCERGRIASYTFDDSAEDVGEQEGTFALVVRLREDGVLDSFDSWLFVRVERQPDGSWLVDQFGPDP